MDVCSEEREKSEGKALALATGVRIASLKVLVTLVYYEQEYLPGQGTKAARTNKHGVENCKGNERSCMWLATGKKGKVSFRI